MSKAKSNYEMSGALGQTSHPVRVRPKAAGVTPAPEDSTLARGFLARAAGVLRQLPGAAAVESGLHQVEKSVLRELKVRIESAVGPFPDGGPDSPPREPSISRTYVHPIPEPAPRAFADLLARAENQTESQARALYCSRLVAQLVPDEALIIATLADGRPQAAIHIALAPLIGSASRVVVENLSLIGSLAKLAWPGNTPAYLTHLIQLGIVESGPETRGMDNAYATLEAGADARNRIAQAQVEMRLSARFTRRTVRLTPLGRVLWEDCQLKAPVSAQ